MKRMIRFGLALALVSAALLPMAAEAKGGEVQVRRSGSCAGHSTWKLKLSKDNGRIETDFEVDQNRVGRKWRVTLKHNGHRFFRGVRTTKAPSGSFEVRKFANNAPDKIVALARNLRSGALCRGVARI
jgi:preprotein translocase subunit SecD